MNIDKLVGHQRVTIFGRGAGRRSGGDACSRCEGEGGLEETRSGERWKSTENSSALAINSGKIWKWNARDRHRETCLCWRCWSGFRGLRKEPADSVRRWTPSPRVLFSGLLSVSGFPIWSTWCAMPHLPAGAQPTRQVSDASAFPPQLFRVLQYAMFISNQPDLGKFT